MKEYIDYLIPELGTRISCFTIYENGSILIEIKPLSTSMQKLYFISNLISQLDSIKSNYDCEFDIIDFDDEAPSLILKLKEKLYN